MSKKPHKALINPLRGKPSKVTKKDERNLALWASVKISARGSVGNFVGTSIRASIKTSFWNSETARDLIGDTVWASVWASVWGSGSGLVKDSNLIWASIRDTVEAQIGYFIQKWEYVEHKKGVYPFQSSVDLWERGFIPCCDSKKWYLLSGKDAKIVYEIDIDKLESIK